MFFQDPDSFEMCTNVHVFYSHLRELLPHKLLSSSKKLLLFKKSGREAALLLWDQSLSLSLQMEKMSGLAVPQQSLVHRTSSINEGSYHFYCLTSSFPYKNAEVAHLEEIRADKMAIKKYIGNTRQSSSKELSLFGLLLFLAFQSVCVYLLHQIPSALTALSLL